jgi:predicted transposase/invertase (TIGR01784 family)
MCINPAAPLERHSMIIGFDPKVDYAFKHVFGREATRPILIDVIDSVLDPPTGHHIREIDLLNPFNPKEALDDKLSILDIKARDQGGRQFNVEMQMLAFQYYEKRILYYWAKLHQQQFHEGQDYQALKPSISISFLDHVLFPETAAYHLRFRLIEESERFPFTDDLDLHILELPKFTKLATELTSRLDVWLYFLRFVDKMDTDEVPAVFQNYPLVLRALEELKMLSQTEAERERYEARRKAQLDYNTGMKVARMEGQKAGRIQALEQLLGRPETPTEQLFRMKFQDLDRLAEELLAQLQKSRV